MKKKNKFVKKFKERINISPKLLEQLIFKTGESVQRYENT